MKKVEIFVLGAMKCGTTSLCAMLDSLYDVCLSDPKETHFFSKEYATSNVQKYLTHFDSVDGLLIDGSTTYSSIPEFGIDVPSRIWKYNKNAKFIYLIRHPIDRLLSNYVHLVERGFIKFSLEEAIKHYPALINRGRYFTQLKPYIDQFGIENILVVKFEDLFGSSKEMVFDGIKKFIGSKCGYDNAIFDLKYNSSDESSKIHHQFDSPSRIWKIGKILPKRIRYPLWNLIRNKLSASKIDKPNCSEKIQNEILALNWTDLKLMEEYFGLDLSVYFETKQSLL